MRIRLITLLFATLCFASTAFAAPVGVFTVTNGQVQVLRGENYLAASPGVNVQSDDIIETGKAASAQVDMEDGSVLKLGPETRVALSDYKLDSNKNVVSATLDVLSGWLRFAVAKLKPSGKYSFNTPVLTVGVRGTEGTIEAENEQGGLHLQEGAVDVTPVGGDIPGLQPVRVTTGEFIQRMRGQQLAKLPEPPDNFKKRLPPVVQEKLTHRAQDLKQRGVPPKVIRAITREDAKRFMERHPHMQDKLRDRFKPLGVNAPDAPGKGLGKGKDAPPGDAKEEAPAGGGFGGKVLRDRQLKTGNSTDPNDVAEGLRKRMEMRRLEKPTADPGATDKLQTRPILTTPDTQPPPAMPGTAPILRDKAILQPMPGMDKPTAPPSSPMILEKPTTLQKPTTTDQKSTEGTETPPKTTSPILQRQQLIGR